MSARSRKLLRAMQRGKPLEMTDMRYAVVDERRIWGVDLDELEAILLKERVAGNVWSRSVMVKTQAEVRPNDWEDAVAHFQALGARGAREAGEAFAPPIRYSRNPNQRRLVVNLISHQNGVGLSQDVALLEELLVGEGHEVRFREYRDMSPEADVNIYLELFEAMHLRSAPTHIGLFNLEWLSHLSALTSMTQCWAKSQEALAIYQRLEAPAVYTGFLSRDMRRPVARKERTCLHVRGKASQKQTEVVFEAWRRHGDVLPDLIVTSAGEPDGWRQTHPRVNFWFEYMNPEDLAVLMSQCRFHVCPSATEGWGHYIAEGISTEAVVITTDASPMNEHVRPEWGVLVPSKGYTSGLVTRYQTDPDVLAAAVIEAASKDDAELEAMGKSARVHWEARQAAFVEKALGLLSHL